MILMLSLAVGVGAGAQAVDTGRAARRDSTLAAPIDTGRAAGAQPGVADTTHAIAAAPAHDTSETGNPAADSALARVRSLVAQGQISPARALVDSLLASTPATSPAYASILYTRATLATNADSAEDDYRRVIVEYAASPHVADALLRLAQLELARGDREQAAAHLDRLTREQLPNQTGATFARTELQVGLAYFDLQDSTKACTALMAAHTAAPTGDVELSNRIDYNTQRCPPPAPPARLASARDTTHRPAGAGAAGRSGKTARVEESRRTRAPGYTVQIAAYQTSAAAAALVKRLRDRGYVARIFGESAPFRVRVGHYTTESQADSAVRSLKGKSITGFVTPAESTQ
jgi:tetratricopeptide (TPR) repeat protein